MSERIKMSVEMEVTIPQALALESMFNYWNCLANAGGSRKVAFYVDGDGNFKPKCNISFDGDVPELTKEMAKLAIIDDKGGDRVYDFDPIGWNLRDKKEKEKEKEKVKKKIEITEKKKKGLLATIWESMTKTGGCCGSGESCCDPSSTEDNKITGKENL